MTTRREWRGTWEMRSVWAIVALCAIVNLAIVLARPAMTRAAMRSFDATLTAENDRLSKTLMEWRQGMIDDGRWAARLSELALDAKRHAIDSLALMQVPTARVWLVGRDGTALTVVGHDTLLARHRWLAAQSLARDTTLVAVTQPLPNDLRIGVGSPMTGKYAGWTVVLDVSAAERLRRRMPRLSVAGHDVQVALAFPYEGGFVGTTWLGAGGVPTITWPKDGWTLDESSLVVHGGALADTTTRFQLGVPRTVATDVASAEALRLHAVSILAALLLIVVVLLIGRAGRNARLRDAERSLAESRLHAAQAEGAANRARLAAVQARLHPHFLSNALHSASALIAEDPDAAEEMLDRLGDLFRYTLESSTQQIVRLADEWKFVRNFLDIEQLRMGNRLHAEMEVDPAAADYEVPAFILQPLVENAIKHGIGPRRNGGTIRVSARLSGDALRLVVEDDGLGPDAASLEASAGTGLETLRERLALDARWRGTLETSTRQGGGFIASITLAVTPNGVTTGDDRHDIRPPAVPMRER